MGFLQNIPDRVAFTVFGFDIMWYGLLIGIGMIVAVVLAYKRAPKHGLNPERVLDTVLWAIPAGVIGARAYYVLFQWDYYKDNLVKILNIREGTYVHACTSTYIYTRGYVGTDSRVRLCGRTYALCRRLRLRQIGRAHV